jgi:beta-N-acetylhexosaminidase
MEPAPSSPIRPRVLAAAIAAAVLAAGCSGSASQPSRDAGATVTATPARPSPPASVPASTASPQSCADRVLAGMSEAQRVGQLFILGLADDRLGPSEIDAIRTEHLGSVTFIETTNEGVGGVRGVTRAVQAQVSEAATGGAGFFVAVNQEGGEIQALRGPGFSTIPSAAEQGTTDTARLRADAERWGRELASAGVDMNFAPVLDVLPPGTDAQNQPIGVLHRAFGHDPETVASHADAFMEGMRRAGIAPVGKHFPGLGRVKGNTDFVAGVVDDRTTAGDPYLGSFRTAIGDGLPFVMVALATYTRIDPANLAVFSPAVIRLLRDGLGFDGVVVSDDMGAATAVADVPAADRAIRFLSAGGDMVISKTVGPAVQMYRGVFSRVGADPAFRAVVDSAARRVLRAKQAFGLLPCGA